MDEYAELSRDELYNMLREANQERHEQARLLGMGAERELALRTRCEKLERELGGKRPSLPDEARPYVTRLIDQIDRLEERNARLMQQVAALTADPNSYQSGYDKGRHDGTKFRLSEVQQERQINDRLTQLLALSREEVYQLRLILSRVAEACGAYVSPECSIGFLQDLPREVKMALSKTRHFR